MRIAALVTTALLVAACSASVGPSPIGPATSPAPSVSATPSEVCHGLAHVYNPSRLHVLASCVSVRGVIIRIRQEPDGDLHVLLRVDADQRDPRGGHFTNPVNDADQSGALVLEPVCAGPVIQPDAVAACAGYHNPLVVPTVGAHVKVSGPWVVDTPHGWLELHPLERAEVLT